MFIRGRTAAAIPVIAAIAIAPTAAAELLMEFTFVGTVWNVVGENPDHPWGHVEIGDEAVFQYVIDVEQEDQSGNPTLGRYDVESVAVTFDGITAVPGEIERLHVDLFTVIGSTEVALVTRDLWLDGDIAIFELRGFGSLQDDGIPIDFELEGFQAERGVGYSDTLGFTLLSEFDSYSYRVIPGPAAWSVLAGAFLVRGRRRSRARLQDRLDSPCIQGRVR